MRIKLTFTAFLLAGTLSAQPGAVDLSFVAGTSIDAGEIRAMAVQVDGKILIGGSFSQYQGLSRLGLVRVHQSGLLDLSYQPPFENTKNPPEVNALAVDSDGGCIVGGRLFVIGVGLRYLIRLEPDGSFDSVFDQNLGLGVNNYIHALAIRTDGNIVIGGSFEEVNGILRSGIAELNAQGSVLDEQEFNGGLVDENAWGGARPTVVSIDIASDGSVYVCGSFTHYGAQEVNSFAKILPDGAIEISHIIDLRYNSEVGGRVSDMLVQPDGSVFIVGLFTEVNGISANHVSHVLSDGAIDESFMLDTSAVYSTSGYSIDRIVSDGGSGFVVVSNHFGSGVRLANYSETGVHYSEFVPSIINSRVLDMVIDQSANLMIGGSSDLSFGALGHGVARIHGRNGSALWQCLEAETIALQSNSTLEFSGDGSGNEVWYEIVIDNCMSLTVTTCAGTGIENFGPGLYKSCPSYPDSIIPLPVGTPNACGGIDHTFEEHPIGSYWLAVQPDSGAYSFTISNVLCGPSDCLQVPGGSAVPGSSCDDDDPGTVNDTWSVDCVCIGDSLLNWDCIGVVDGSAVPGTPCNDGILFTTNDSWTGECVCAGYDCAGVQGGSAFPGTPCDDQDPNTLDDTWSADCTCGSLVGVREVSAQHPAFRIVPNPCALTSFELLSDAPQGAIEVRLLDGALREVRRSVLSNAAAGGYTMDRKGLPSGLYIVEVRSAEHRSLYRLILQ